MPDIIPTLLAPYLDEALKPFSCTLVTSTLSTPANWVLVRLLYASIKGFDDSGIRSTIQQQTIDGNTNLIFVSLTRPLDLWVELCKKAGLDLPSLIRSKNVHYIDGLSISSHDTTESGVVNLKALTLDALSEAISSATKTISNTTFTNTTQSTSRAKPPILIDGLDFLFACQPDVDTVTIQGFLQKVRSIARSLVVTSSADAPLLHSVHDAATPLERDHTALVSTLAYQSQWVLQLRGLDTGSAKDVTGVLRMSMGGAYGDAREQGADLEEAEWLYQVKGDGSARVWSRGE